MASYDRPTSLKDRAAEIAKQTGQDALDAAEASAVDAKLGLAQTSEGAARATRAVSDELPEGSASQEALDHAAAQIDAVTDYLTSRPIQDLAEDVSTFARRNPGLFLGAAAVAGFAAARFLKSSEPRQTYRVDPWSNRLDEEIS